MNGPAQMIKAAVACVFLLRAALVGKLIPASPKQMGRTLVVEKELMGTKSWDHLLVKTDTTGNPQNQQALPTGFEAMDRGKKRRAGKERKHA